MKNNIKFMLLFVAMLLFGFSARAGSKMAINDVNTTQTYDITVNVETMGTFCDALSAAMAEAGCGNMADISRLTVTGNVNNEDLNYLRDNVGATLYALDLGNVTVEENRFDWETLNNCGFSELVLPNSLELIDGINYCVNLKSINIPSSVKKIGNGICNRASSLEYVTGGECITNIGGSSFAGCPNLKSLVIFNDIFVRLPESFVGAYEIPEHVTHICDGAMSGVDGLASITIPDGVSSIPSNFAFDCNNLEEVTIGKSVNSIRGSAFSAINIKNVYCLGKTPPVWNYNGWYKSFYGDINPEAVLHVHSNCVSSYENSDGWKDFPTIIGDLGIYPTYDITVNVEAMGTFSDALSAAMAEAGCGNMADISRLTVTGNVNNEDLNYLRDNVGATLYALDLGNVTVEENRFDWYTLNNCGFSELVLPNSLESISGIKYCFNLKSINIPSSVKEIGYGLCYRASSLEYVTGGECITKIWSSSFEECPNLKSPVIFNNIFVRLPESFVGAYEIPGHVTHICSQAMSGVDGLTSITIPNGVLSIPYNFAGGCNNLEEVTIGKWVNNIGQRAFPGNNIKHVYCLGKIPSEWGDEMNGRSAFYDINPNAVLHVYSNCVSRYKKAYGWKDFPTIVGDLSEYQTYDITVNVETMGTFSEALDAAMAEAGCDYMYDICRLTVTGNVNNDDLNYLRDNIGATLEALDLGEVTVENNRLGYGVLRDCAFSEVILPNSVEFLDEWYILSNCVNLKTLDIPSSVKKIGGGFCSGATSLEYVTGGDGVVDCNYDQFKRCPSLRSPVILNNILFRLPENTVGIYKVPENVTCIATDAMTQVPGLTSLTLPESITKIEDRVLEGDENLRDIYFYAVELPMMTYGAFRNFDQQSCTLHVFANMVEAFQNDVIWSDFNIVGDLDEISEKLVTNKYDMSKGWNWVSTNIVTDAVPFIKPIDDKVNRLVSQTDELVNDPDYGIVGTLNSLDVTAGYKLQTTDVAAFEHYGMVTIPSEQSVLLSNGWNWIGYLPIRTLPVGYALNNLQAVEGDRLISQNGFAVYGANGWEGDLQVMNPGEGYMYYRAADETAFNYPDKSTENQDASLNAMKYASQDSGNDSPWTCDIHCYPDVTTIIAKLYVEDKPVNLANYSVGVFCGQECRGVAKQVGDKLFITIHGTIKDEETISFLAYERASGEILPVNETIAFKGQVLGELTNPMALHIQSETTSISDISVLSDVRAIYSPTGKRVNSLQQGVNIVVYADGTTRKVVVPLDR